jgi:hypothetical protein
MLLPLLFYWKAADSSIMTYCNCISYWIFHDSMPKIIDTLLRLIFRIWERASHLLFRNNGDWYIYYGRMWQCSLLIAECVWLDGWHSVDAHINHIETTFVHPRIVYNESYTHFWHPVLHLYALLFASRSVVSSQFLINCYLRSLSAKWRGPIRFSHIRPAIDSM